MAYLLAQISLPAAADIHRQAGWWVAGVLGIVGLIGIILHLSRREPGRWFWVLFGLAVVGVLGQVGLGLYAFSVDEEQPGNIHVFYGVVILFTLAFAYIYRAQLGRRPALAYGLLALFIMGLGLRAIGNFGESFGG
jgi:hypothetical protein